MKTLNTEQVYEIKKMLKEGRLKQKEIAEMFNVSRSTISNINKGKIFSYIVVPSDEYQEGYEKGYEKGFEDGKKFIEINLHENGHSSPNI